MALLALFGMVGAAVLVLAGIGLGSILHPSTTTITATGAIPVGLPASTPGATVSGTSQEPAAAVAQLLGPAIVTLDNGTGLGSGVIYDPSGLVLTNAHVTEGSTTLNVQLADGRTLKGAVLGSDPEADISVVKIDPTNLTVATLSTAKVLVGETAIAIGSPFGLPQTVTEGIVSAVDRPVDGNAGVAVNMIQTDAPINPGNSGGALADRTASVIGINTSIFSQTGDNSGIGFAIPIQTAKTVADKIVKGQPLDHAYLGVSSKAPTNGDTGVQIARVQTGGPGAKAGLQAGDIVTGVDSAPINTPGDLSATIVGHAPGDTVTLHLQRKGQSQDVTVTLGARPPSTTPGVTRRTKPGG